MVNLAMKDHGEIFKEIEAITIIYKLMLMIRCQEYRIVA